MKFAFCIAVLGLMATIEASPATETGTYGTVTLDDIGGESDTPGSKYFASTGQLDSIQGALNDISAAGADLETIKGKLEALVDGSASVYAAEAALETAVDSAAYTNAFVEAPVVTIVTPAAK